MQAIADDIVDSNRVSAFTAQGLTNVLWGFATLRYYPHSVLVAICEELHRRLHSISAQVGRCCSRLRRASAVQGGRAGAGCFAAPPLLCTRHEVIMSAGLPALLPPRCCARGMRSLRQQGCPAASRNSDCANVLSHVKHALVAELNT